MTANPLDAIAAMPPDFDESIIRRLLADVYDIRGELTPFVSERDQNTRVDADTGARFVLKIANAAEDPVVTDFQVRVLMHLEGKDCQVTVPMIVATTNGDPVTRLGGPSGTHLVRLVSYIDGALLRDVPISAELAGRFGERLAQLDNSLNEFQHPGDRQILLWDMQRASQLRPLLRHIDDMDVRRSTRIVLDDFEQRVLPRLPELDTQVIHGDANPDNVLVDTTTAAVVGMIDFGDMVRAAPVIDIAIAASYFRELEGDALQYVLPFVAGYHSISRLTELEIELLFDLIRTRLATTISILYWRLSARSENDPYRQATLEKESSAQTFLSRLDDIGRKSCIRALQDAVQAVSPESRRD